MSAQVAYAKNVLKGRVEHINDVPIDSEDPFICCECKNKLSPVKTLARKKDWHFRHYGEFDLEKCRNTALHDYAVQVLLDNTSIVLSKHLNINYTVTGKEVWLNDQFRSDVTVRFETNVLHFEVFVTHDNEPAKNEFYETNKIKCCRINLSDKSLLSAPPATVKDIVLNQFKNKTLFGWYIEQPKKWYEKPENIFGIIILAIISYFTFFKKTKKR